MAAPLPEVVALLQPGDKAPAGAPAAPLPRERRQPGPPAEAAGPRGAEPGRPPPQPSEGPRAAAGALAALVLCPGLLYGAYVFLPLEAPPLPGAPARLLYALRCAAFATVPIVLGVLVHGAAGLCAAAAREPPRREARLHRAFVAQSAQLFSLYFLHVALLATQLPQEALKLVPLLAGLFAVSRLIYWLLYAVGRSFRAFGFTLTFLPLLAMQLYNLYGMFVLEPDGAAGAAGAGELRLWG